MDNTANSALNNQSLSGYSLELQVTLSKRHIPNTSIWRLSAGFAVLSMRTGNSKTASFQVLKNIGTATNCPPYFGLPHHTTVRDSVGSGTPSPALCPTQIPKSPNSRQVFTLSHYTMGLDGHFGGMQQMYKGYKCESYYTVWAACLNT